MAKLKDLIDELELESQTEDSLFRVKSRFMMAKYFRDGMRHLNLSFGRQIDGINVEIPSSCRVYKPSDFLQFVRAYILNCDGKTIELKRNNKIPRKIYNFLVSCDGKVLEDCNEESLYDECVRCNETDDASLRANCEVCCGEGKYIPEPLRSFLSDLKKYHNSWISEKEEYFEFSSDLEGVFVIIEYVSSNISNVDECLIDIPNDYEDALNYYVKYKLLEGGQDTLSASQYFKKSYKNAKNVLNKNSNAMTMADLDSILLMKQG